VSHRGIAATRFDRTPPEDISLGRDRRNSERLARHGDPGSRRRVPRGKSVSDAAWYWFKRAGHEPRDAIRCYCKELAQQGDSQAARPSRYRLKRRYWASSGGGEAAVTPPSRSPNQTPCPTAGDGEIGLRTADAATQTTS
jgi:hypothetical protein